MCTLWVCMLLKIVSHYDLSALSILMMGFHRKKFGWVVVEWGELNPVFWGILLILLTLQSSLLMKRHILAGAVDKEEHQLVILASLRRDHHWPKVLLPNDMVKDIKLVNPAVKDIKLASPASQARR